MTGRVYYTRPESPRVSKLSKESVLEQLRALARRYPDGLVALELEDVERIAFHIELVADRCGADAAIYDLGSGVGLFGVGCAAVGMKVTIVDDFDDHVNHEYGDSVLDLHRSVGVEVRKQSPIEEGFAFGRGNLDAVTCFDSMEHWHGSPKGLFRRVIGALRPGGLFVVATPNCVNLRKRISMPFGYAKWSSMWDWYEHEVFRGHVREPDIADLLYIARDIGLDRVEILGRNWAGLNNESSLVRRATRLADRLIRLRPSLCSDIYLVGHKPE